MGMMEKMFLVVFAGEVGIIYLLVIIIEHLKAIRKNRSGWDRVLMDKDGWMSDYDANVVRKKLGLEEHR